MARKGENIRKRKDGRWEGRYKVKDIASGKEKYRSVYAKTYREVKIKLLDSKQNYNKELQAYEQQDHAQKMPASSSIGKVAEEWLIFIKKNRKYSTYVKYRTIYEQHIKKDLAQEDISSLTAFAVEQILVKEQIHEGSLTKSVYCVANQIIDYANEYEGLSIDKIIKKKNGTKAKPAAVLNNSEQQQLIQELYADMDKTKLGIVLCFSLGLRLGEICALKWTDVDLQNKLLYINRTVQRIASEGGEKKTMLLESEPKSVYSKRTVPLTDDLVALLRQFQQNGEYLVSGTRPTEPRTYQNRFHKILSKAGIRKCNFHILRHTFATNCINTGVDVKSLSEILGHADVSITLNRYVHPSMETKRQCLNAMTSIYGQYRGQEGMEGR